MTLQTALGLDERLPRIGDSWKMPPEDEAWALLIARRQHEASGARGSRGAGANEEYRVKGVKGEIACARIMGITPQVRALAGPDMACDLWLGDVPIEVKTGHPMVWRAQVKEAALYVAIHPSRSTFTVTHIAYGYEIRAHALLPPWDWCPREGTRALNWQIPLIAGR